MKVNCLDGLTKFICQRHGVTPERISSSPRGVQTFIYASALLALEAEGECANE